MRHIFELSRFQDFKNNPHSHKASRHTVRAIIKNKKHKKETIKTVESSRKAGKTIRSSQ